MFDAESLCGIIPVFKEDDGYYTKRINKDGISVISKIEDENLSKYIVSIDQLAEHRIMVPKGLEKFDDDIKNEEYDKPFFIRLAMGIFGIGTIYLTFNIILLGLSTIQMVQVYLQEGKFGTSCLLTFCISLELLAFLLGTIYSLGFIKLAVGTRKKKSKTKEDDTNE